MENTNTEQIYEIKEIDGTTQYFKLGKRHREDGPAYITHNLEIYYTDGLKHRINGPAHIVKEDGKVKEAYYFYKGIKSNSLEEHLILMETYGIRQTVKFSDKRLNWFQRLWHSLF